MFNLYEGVDRVPANVQDEGKSARLFVDSFALQLAYQRSEMSKASPFVFLVKLLRDNLFKKRFCLPVEPLCSSVSE